MRKTTEKRNYVQTARPKEPPHAKPYYKAISEDGFTETLKKIDESLFIASDDYSMFEEENYDYSMLAKPTDPSALTETTDRSTLTATTNPSALTGASNPPSLTRIVLNFLGFRKTAETSSVLTHAASAPARIPGGAASSAAPAPRSPANAVVTPRVSVQPAQVEATSSSADLLAYLEEGPSLPTAGKHSLN